MNLRARTGCACVALLCAAIAPPAARAADRGVLTLGADGRARTSTDPFAPVSPDLPERAGADAVRAPRAMAARRRTVPGELKRLLAEGAMDRDAYDERRAAYDHARDLVRRLPGARKVELGAVVAALEGIAARGELTPSRLPELWLTLGRNVRWWTTGPLLVSHQRVAFAGSELVWQYYPRQGIQLQVLASFGKLNGLWQGKRYDDRLAHLLDELLALPAERAGGLAWEYVFPFDGGRPPWVSGLAQGTAVQALARAAIRLHRESEVLPVAQRALTVFETPPPAGVRLPSGDGAHYLIYSFAPGLRVLNGFAQAVIGLTDFATATGDARAAALAADGERAARRETPAFDTGAWSLYSRGTSSQESDLSYHRLLTDFLAGLCRRTGAREYCTTRARFSGYLRTPPVVSLATRRLRGGTDGRLRFRLSKVSRVGVQVLRGGRRVLVRPAFLAGRGLRSVPWAVPRARGGYDVRVTAVDLAGNVGTATGRVRVLSPR